jgi:hypothetical protein
LFDTFPIQNGLKQGNVLTLLLFNFAPGKSGGLKLNGTLPLLAYVDDVNLLGDNIHTIKKSPKALINVSKDVDL